MKQLIWMSISGLLALPVAAQSVPMYEMRRSGSGYEYVPVDPDTRTIQAGFHAYDNWRDSSIGGMTQARGTYAFGGNEIGDDLNLVTTGPAQVTDLGWTIYNRSTTRTLQSATFVLRLYDSNQHLLFQFSNPLGFVVPPNSGAALFTNSNVFARFNIVISSPCFMSLQYTNTVGADGSDIGGILAGPCTTGSSTHFAYNFTGGSQIDFDGSDQTNMAFFIDTATIPAPGGLVVAMACASLSARRRRQLPR